MAKEIVALTTEEILTARMEAVDILITNHEEEFRRILKGKQFDVKEAKANKVK